MTPPHNTDPRDSGREALEQLWVLGQRLAQAWRDLSVMLPIHLPVEPENPALAETEG
ncbi:hypothetical protein Rumeso_04060 [Rubellimicrobium mesophilum DSM 19309]|uniref:Uncharacterized protein n=1 Tax=Rubellimicrobium mesophilum DSM 19309 TaxID=442562 RepID=A0A017HJ69_9RHOB|nr:hypothetical protein [Rubellimicrobium mesophilum]EYD74375.1 hypothetical protein Rumeso_04060 [Rubellimicrobium mesophilum DSM 19309]